MSVIYLPSILMNIPRSPITAVGLPLALGLLSGYPTAKVVQGHWYNSLIFPPGRPPRQAFPIVWSFLYVAMGFASHLAVNAYDTTLSVSTASASSKGLALYYAQLGLNLAWTPLFFVKKQTGLALVDSVLLAGSTIYMTALLHGPTGGLSTYLLLPYCAWASYATYLNAGIWWLNRGRFIKKVD